LRRVLEAGAKAGLGEAWVVGGDGTVRDLVQGLGALWMPEEGSSLNETLEAAFQRALLVRKGPLYLPADLPFLCAEDLGGLLGSANRQTHLALAPARLGGGTNALFLSGGALFRPALGPESFQRHLSLAVSRDMGVSVYYSRGLAWDLDTPEDLAFYEAASPGLRAELTRARALGAEDVPPAPTA
jgi:2-phospho-L-lactate guanylyltransferase